jgi:hypothetical protein
MKHGRTMIASLLALAGMLFPGTGRAATLEECAQFIVDNFESVGICGSGDWDSCASSASCHVEIRGCEIESDDGVSCIVEHSHASSECVQRITLDPDCNFNRSAEIVEDGREDL